MSVLKIDIVPFMSRFILCVCLRVRARTHTFCVALDELSSLNGLKKVAEVKKDFISKAGKKLFFFKKIKKNEFLLHL